jgi:soluble lytic murein transglycosylase-like protein
MKTRRISFALCLLPFAFCCAFASDASAEIVVFKNGRTMSARSVTVSAGMATLALRNGGEVTFPAGIIDRIDPDEVPYDEPTVAEIEAPVAAPAVVAQLSDAALAQRPFADLISSVAAAHEMDLRLIHAVIEQESNYQPRARSKKGARGLMQLMPATARQYGVRNSYDPKANLEAGVRHLKDLLSRLDLPVALAAYNAGEGTIQRYGGLPPYPETKNYVRSILRRLGRTAGN